MACTRAVAACLFQIVCAIDTSTAGGRLQFHMLGALAEFERALISERTKAGMAAARTRGIALGRPSKLSDAQIKDINGDRSPGSLSDIAKQLDVSPCTVRRAITNRRKLRA
ncbi:MAG: recombinase family protein [Proteobacteria bacterium]|nr:recombinase family protein [Pseudomonadota bacterium]